MKIHSKVTLVRRFFCSLVEEWSRTGLKCASCAEMQKALDESFDVIQEILEHVCNNMVAENAVAFVTVSAADQTPAKLMSAAVEERLSKLNQMTLHTIHSLLASPTVQQQRQTKVLLEMMKKEILKQAGHALPVELQTLDRLIMERDDEARTAVIHVRLLHHDGWHAHRMLLSHRPYVAARDTPRQSTRFWTTA